MEIAILERAITLGIGTFISILVLIWKRSDDHRYSKTIAASGTSNKEHLLGDYSHRPMAGASTGFPPEGM